MKKLTRVLFLVAMTVLMAISLCGCTSALGTANGQLIFNDDLSGMRVITVEVNKSTYSEYCQATYEQLVDMVNETIPEQLKVSSKDEDNVMSFVFTLEFKSVKDYNAKINAIMKTTENPVETVVDVPEGIWSAGAKVTETISNTDLLKWLSDAMISYGYVTEENRSYIVGNGSYTVNINGISENCYGSMSMDSVRKAYIRNIESSTTILGPDSFDRSIRFTVSTGDGIDTDKISNWIASRAGKNATVTPTVDSTWSMTVLVEYKALSKDKMADALKNLFSDYSFKMEAAGADSSYILCGNTDITESFTVKDYFFNDCKNIGVSDSFLLPEGSDYSLSNSREYCTLSTDENGQSALEITTKMSHYYTLLKLDAKTSFNSEDKVVQSFDIKVKESLTKDEEKTLTESIKVALENASAESTVKKLDYKLDVDNKKDGLELSVVFSGDVSNAIEGIKRFTGRSTNISYVSTYKPMKVKYEKSFDVSMNLSRIASKTADNFAGTFILDAGKGAKITYCSSEKALISGNNVSTQLKLSSNSYSVNASCTNGLAIVLIIVIIVVVILVLAVVAIIVLKALKKTPSATKNKAPEFVFCPECGTKLPSDSAFCGKCGHKF